MLSSNVRAVLFQQRQIDVFRFYTLLTAVKTEAVDKNYVTTHSAWTATIIIIINTYFPRH